VIGHRQAGSSHRLTVTADSDSERQANAPRPNPGAEVANPVGALAFPKTREGNQDGNETQSGKYQAKNQDGSKQYAQEAHAFQPVFH
jgi:phage/plasmid primase-like uncharacterized protein